MSSKASQWSLRSLLIAAAIIPAAIYMLVKANPMLVSVAVTISITAWIATAIVAVVGTGERQAFARGALIAATVYGAVVYYLDELNLQTAKLFTTGLLYHAHEACVTRIIGSTQSGFGGAGGMMRMMMANESPMAGHFAIIGQIYWGVLIAILGGWFAWRVVRREQNEAAERPTTDGKET
jgi:hypothetical protein